MNVILPDGSSHQGPVTIYYDTVDGPPLHGLFRTVVRLHSGTLCWTTLFYSTMEQHWHCHFSTLTDDGTTLRPVYDADPLLMEIRTYEIHTYETHPCDQPPARSEHTAG